MKALFVFLCCFFLLSSTTKGQCIENPDFEFAGAMNVAAGACPSWENIPGQTSIVPNWDRSHGLTEHCLCNESNRQRYSDVGKRH